MVELWPIYEGLELVFVRGFRIIGIIFDSQVAKSLIIKNYPFRHVWYGLVSHIVELFVEFSYYRVPHVYYEVS